MWFNNYFVEYFAKLMFVAIFGRVLVKEN